MQRSFWFGAFWGAAVVVTLSAALAAAFALRTNSTKAPTAPTLTLSMVDHKVLADEWIDQIRSERFWRARPAPPPSGAPLRGPRSNLQGPPPDSSWFLTPSYMPPMWDEAPQTTQRQRGGGSSGYRTVCVRTCDGYFFPVSFGVSESQFSRDQATCSSACPGARLYHYRASGQDPEDMVDSSGEPYSRMKNANLFRTQYVASCKCKPHPWEQEASDKHRLYALEAQRRKGDRSVVAELNDLRTKARAQTRAERQASRNSRRNERRRQSQPALPAAEIATPATSSALTVASANLPPPRSDASRGQGGERWPQSSVIATQPSAPGPAATTYASVPAAVAAKPAVPETGPSSSPIGRAAAAVASGQQPPPASTGQSPLFARHVPFTADEPNGIAPTPAAAPEAAPAPLPAPEPLALPFSAETGESSAEPAVSQERRNGRGANSGRSGRKKQDTRRAKPAPGVSRSASWTNRVFQN